MSVTQSRYPEGLQHPASDPGAETPLARHRSLVEQYARMAQPVEPRPVDLALRALDVAISATAFTVTAPVQLAIAAVSKLLAPRAPILYRGWRVGKGGELFQMLKFRTLAPDAEQRFGSTYGPELTVLTQSEVTRWGRLLRASKLDELPQLINVVRGEMSLVGPRPVRPAFFEDLCTTVPQYWQRLVVRPGVTGLAQLRLTREMAWGEKLAHDLEYIADRSIRLYISVLTTTVWLMIMRPANRRATLNHLP